jgi:hypothetical protein
VTQPTFAPVPLAGQVRRTTATATPELARSPKAGLQRSPVPASGTGHGTPAPGEGYALTISAHVLASFTFEHEHDRHDVELGIGLVAAKRASLVGRGPIPGDVRVALHIFAIEGPTVAHVQCAPFVGIAHSYVAQRRFVDAVSADQLVPGHVSR